MGSISAPDTRAVFFFDIDNCLYSKSKNIHEHMGVLINKYFVSHLQDMSPEDATELHLRYYKDYGLAIEGLARFHQIDPLDFNHEVDDALPLDDILYPDPELRRMLESFDKSKVKMWLFTNAHITHGMRVVRLLDVADLFEGITYCDYSQRPLVPKPRAEMFEKAQREAQAFDDSKIYYIDDSALNCKAAFGRGWVNTVHLAENQVPGQSEQVCKYQISRFSEVMGLFPELLKKDVSYPSETQNGL